MAKFRLLRGVSCIASGQGLNKVVRSMRSSIRFPLIVAALCTIAIILTKCPGPIPPGWDKDSPLNQPHPPRR